MANMNYNKKITDTQVRVGEVLFSYVNVFEPRQNMSGEPKYSCAILIDKSNTAAISLIEEAIDAAMEQGKTSKWGGKIPRNVKSPLRDGDEERDDPVYANKYFLNASASTKVKPAVKILENGKLVDALDSEDFYSGCLGVAVVNFFPYSASGNNGVGCGLNVVMKTKDGERLSGGVSAESALAGLYD